MAETPICDFGWDARPFKLPSTGGETITLADAAGENGTLVMFICNHCPYVIGVLDRLKSEAQALQALGVGVVAICSNDATTHPADSFPKMQELAAPTEAERDLYNAMTLIAQTGEGPQDQVPSMGCSIKWKAA